MKVLFFGDVVGKIGRRALAQILPALKDKYQPDAVVVNVENLAHGKGVTAKTLQEMAALKIDCFTSGNHVWKKEEVAVAAKESNALLLTPANDPRTPKSQGFAALTVGSKKLFVINLLGRVFMDQQDADPANELRCPFKEADKILEEVNGGAVLIDFHAEATSEKIALGWYLDGRAAAVLGTHTHVPTADLKILPQGTAHVSDVGMIGPVDSVLGVKKELIIEKFLTDGPIVFNIPESGEVEVNGVYLEIDEKTNLAVRAEKIHEITVV